MNKLYEILREHCSFLFYYVINPVGIGEIIRTTVAILIAFAIISLLGGCGTTSLHGCDNKLGIEKDLCREQIKIVQHQIWKYQTKDGYLE